MAFRKKADDILALNPDIIVIPESEHPDKIDFGLHIRKPNQVFWCGDNYNKGLLVASYNSSLNLTEIPHHSSGTYILPISVQSKNDIYNIFAIWAQKGRTTFDSYVVQASRAIKNLEKHLDGETIIIGDFNSNACWDNGDKKEITHTQLVTYFEQKNIFSGYHYLQNERHGYETKPTLYMYRKIDRPYHVDYAFMSKGLLGRLDLISIGEYEKWSDKSDHMPLILEFNQF